MTLTQEQNEQWQAAFPLLDYLDFHALSADGLRESRIRLGKRGVPKWPIDFREELILREWLSEKGGKGTWVPEFALRSEVALIGLTVTHPDFTEALPVYLRLFMRFVAEELRPFAEYASRAGWYRRSGYQSLVKLHELCEGFCNAGSDTPWPEHLEAFPKRMFYQLLDRIPVSGPATLEISFAYSLSSRLLDITTRIRKQTMAMFWYMSRTWNLANFIEDLEIQHAWRIEGNIENRQPCRDLVADAYLTALEAECPPPDWLLEAMCCETHKA